MARFLGLEWIEQFNEAVRDAALPGPSADAGLGARSGSYAWCQLVTGGPGGEVQVTVRVADGRLSMEAGAAPDAAVTIRIGWDDARAMASGELSPAEAISSGRVRVRGDLAVLSEGQSLLAALAPRLADLNAATTY